MFEILVFGIASFFAYKVLQEIVTTPRSVIPQIDPELDIDHYKPLRGAFIIRNHVSRWDN